MNCCREQSGVYKLHLQLQQDTTYIYSIKGGFNQNIKSTTLIYNMMFTYTTTFYLSLAQRLKTRGNCKCGCI